MVKCWNASEQKKLFHWWEWFNAEMILIESKVNAVLLLYAGVTQFIWIMYLEIMYGNTLLHWLFVLPKIYVCPPCLRVCRDMQQKLTSLACTRRPWEHTYKDVNILAHTLTHIHTQTHGATWTSLHQRYICFLCMFDGTGRQRLATARSYCTD